MIAAEVEGEPRMTRMNRAQLERGERRALFTQPQPHPRDPRPPLENLRSHEEAGGRTRCCFSPTSRRPGRGALVALLVKMRAETYETSREIEGLGFGPGWASSGSVTNFLRTFEAGKRGDSPLGRVLPVLPSACWCWGGRSVQYCKLVWTRG